MNSKWIPVTSADGGQFDAYVSYPPTGHGPGLNIVLGVDHGFNCWRRPAWNQNTAARARGQTLVHLAESLG